MSRPVVSERPSDDLRRATPLVRVALAVAVAALLTAPLLPQPAESAVAATSLSASETTAPAEGSFVSNRGNVYRIVGGAPVHVASWNAFGGEQPTTALDDAGFAALPTAPADGTFISGMPSGEVYRIAGGAPLFVDSWDAFDGGRPAVAVDDAAVAHAGEPGVWSHLRAAPLDGTFIGGTRRGEVYRIAGGAPVFVSGWAAFDGVRPLVTVDDAAIDHAGEGAPWSHLRATPADGTLIRGTSARTNRIVYGGVPRTTENQGLATVVDQTAIDRAGTGGIWNHLLAEHLPTTAPTPSTSLPTAAPVASPRTVRAASTTLAVVRPRTVVAGRSVTLTVTVRSTGDLTGGVVALRGNGTVRATAVLTKNGTATIGFIAKNRSSRSAPNTVRVAFLGTATAAPSSNDASYRSTAAAPAVLTGTVRDAATGTGVPRARVDLVPAARGYGDTKTAITDASGRYAVALPPGVYMVRVHRASSGSRAASTSGLVIEAGGAYRIDQRLQR